MKATAKAKTEWRDDPATQWSPEKRTVCAKDILLRKFGFSIHERRGKKEAVWSLEGDLYTEREALIVVQRLQEEAK